jgi:hypothetical protein
VRRPFPLLSASLLSYLVASLLAYGCARPATSPSELVANLTLSNLQAKQLGLSHAVCGGDFEYAAIDELTFDAEGAQSDYLIGVGLYAQRDDGSLSLLGNIAQCPASTTPCTNRRGSVCLVNGGDNGGQVRVYARVTWVARQVWNLRVRTAGTDSNAVEAVIDRPDNLPLGPGVGVAFLEVNRTSAGSGSFRQLVFHPDVPGRMVQITREVWSGPTLFSTTTTTFAETPSNFLHSNFGGLLLPSSPFEVRVTVVERDASGTVLSSATKSVFGQ